MNNVFVKKLYWGAEMVILHHLKPIGTGKYNQETISTYCAVARQWNMVDSTGEIHPLIRTSSMSKQEFIFIEYVFHMVPYEI